MKAKIILALDVDSLPKAKYFVNKLYPQIKIFKVGLQLFTACGPKIIEFIHKKGGEVFLDLKFFDIPNTIGNAVRQAVRFKVNMLTLHIMGGIDMLKSAVRQAKEESRRLQLKRPRLIGVTILTSQEASAPKVLRLAKIGLDARLDGLVCSVQDIAFLRKNIKRKFIAVTPGIRPYKIKGDDQKRTATVNEALSAGSDFLVIGRPILEAKDSFKVITEIKESHGRKDGEKRK